MRLTPPTKTVFYLSLLLAALGVIGYFVSIAFISDYAFWFVVVGYVLLALGNAMKGV